MIRLALLGTLDGPAPIAQAAARLRGGRFTAVVDPSVHAVSSTASALGVALWSESLDKLLSDHAEEFDAVVVRGWGLLDTQLCQRAAAAGKHILADSPLAASAAAAADMIDACARAGVRLLVGHVCRFLPALRVVKESFESGKLGEPGLLRIHRWESVEVQRRQEGPAPAEGLPDLFRRMTHEIDLAYWLFGRSPTEVYAAGRQPHGTSASHRDYVQLHLGFGGGGMALIDCARTLPPGDAYSSLSLIGSAGAAYADDHHNMQLLFGGGRPAAFLTRDGDGYLVALLQEFVSALAEKREPSVPGADGLTALQVAEAAAESLATGQALRRTGERYEVATGGQS